MTASSQVVVVDGEPLVRFALKNIISSAGHVVRTFGTARDFLANDWRHVRGCLLLDVQLPDMDGFELHRRLRGLGISAPAIFLARSGDIAMSVRAIKAGAVDFLTKPLDCDILLKAIGAALSADSRRLDDPLEVEDWWVRLGSLTRREHDVLQLIAAGLLNKQIARKLMISEKTVKVHRARVMEKMGARHVAPLVRLAFELGLSEDGSDAPRRDTTRTDAPVRQADRRALSSAVGA